VGVILARDSSSKRTQAGGESHLLGDVVDVAAAPLADGGRAEELPHGGLVGMQVGDQVIVSVNVGHREISLRER
jgi:hypothetical protein